MKKAILNFLMEEDGLSAVEYAIAGALVIGVAAGGFITLGQNVDAQIDELADCVNGNAGGTCGGGAGP